jgi:hypothetical protein
MKWFTWEIPKPQLAILLCLPFSQIGVGIKASLKEIYFLFKVLQKVNSQKQNVLQFEVKRGILIVIAK